MLAPPGNIELPVACPTAFIDTMVNKKTTYIQIDFWPAGEDPKAQPTPATGNHFIIEFCESLSRCAQAGREALSIQFQTVPFGIPAIFPKGNVPGVIKNEVELPAGIGEKPGPVLCWDRFRKDWPRSLHRIVRSY